MLCSTDNGHTGVIVGKQLVSRLGRRATVQFMCVWTIICTTILMTSRNRHQMMAGRALNYLYMGMELAVIPLYQAEITPLRARGAMVATYNTSLALGMLVMSSICRGTSSIRGKASYLIPLGLFYLVPVIVLFFSFFIPESPRWLVLHDRHEEAFEVLKSIRLGKFTEEEIQEEFAAIRAIREIDSSNDAPAENFWNRWIRIFNSRHMKRTVIVLGTNFFLHGTGNAFSTKYGTIFFKSIGTVNPFTLTTINTVLTVITSIVTLFLVDSLGRRPLLLSGSFVQAAALLTMGGLGMAKRTTAVSGAIIATKMIFTVGYTAAWGQLSHTITAEVPAAEVRDTTYATGSFLAVATQAAVTFSLPYLLDEPYAGLGPKVGFIFGGLTAISVLFAFFFIPECKGKSLEEIDVLFNNNVPVRKFQDTKLVVESSGKEGGSAVEIELVEESKRRSTKC